MTQHKTNSKASGLKAGWKRKTFTMTFSVAGTPTEIERVEEMLTICLHSVKNFVDNRDGFGIVHEGHTFDEAKD